MLLMDAVREKVALLSPVVIYIYIHTATKFLLFLSFFLSFFLLFFFFFLKTRSGPLTPVILRFKFYLYDLQIL
jgi:hypothetical protein